MTDPIALSALVAKMDMPVCLKNAEAKLGPRYCRVGAVLGIECSYFIYSGCSSEPYVTGSCTIEDEVDKRLLGAARFNMCLEEEAQAAAAGSPTPPYPDLGLFE